MPRTLPTTKIRHNNETYEVSFEWALECKHCEHVTRTASEQDRVSCGQCNRKNPRSQITGQYFEEYLKYSLFTGEEEALDAVTAILRDTAQKYEAMQANGWVFDCTTKSSHVAMHKGDVPPQKITA